MAEPPNAIGTGRTHADRKEHPERPAIPLGALIGGIFAAPLAAAAYLGRQLADLPFPPFDFFDAIARLLPGRLVTSGIDGMVTAIRVLGYRDISSAAKFAEHILAIGLFLFAGAIGGGLTFALLRNCRPTSAPLLGSLAGAVVGAASALLDRHLHGISPAGPLGAAIWVMALFAAWGGASGFVYSRWASLYRADAAHTLADVAPAEASAAAIDRRTFLIRIGGAAATLPVGGAWVGASLSSLRDRERKRASDGSRRWSATHPLPNSSARVEPVRGTRPELTPLEDHYRIDINSLVPDIPEADWRLRIGGLVDRPREWTLAELRDGYAPLHQFVTLACISNPLAGSLIGTQRWSGVPVRSLMREVGPQGAAGHLRIRAADGFDESVPLAQVMEDERIMLAYAWDGLPLTAEHGFPLRIYIPDRYGMKQPKWIESIELTGREEEGYWVRRGWSREARMKATSVIDAVGVDMMIVGADRKSLIPIGGMAHAGARGIAKVEVSVDGDAWREAALRDPLSGTTWVLWRYDWPFEPGKHVFTVRCTDGNGRVQEESLAPPHPGGATGWDQERAMF